MENHRKLSDIEFLEAFKNCSFNPADFSHEAHLRLAYLQIKGFGLEKALDNVVSQLQNYVVHVGAGDKFNMTLTQAAVRAVFHFMQKSNAEDFLTFMAEFPRLKYAFKELMACHYGFDIFNSERAKSVYLEPDLLAFS